MKSVFNKLIRAQKGQVIIVVLVFILVGGLIVAPLLSYIYTGLKVGEDVYEEGTLQLYAADAGVEYGIYRIAIKPDDLPQAPGDPVWTGDITDVNGKYVDPITVTYVNETTYGINATATDNLTGDSTRIESYVSILSFKNFMDNAVTSMNDVIMQPSSNVTGDVQYNGLEEDSIWKGDVNGDIYTDPIEGWPTPDELIKYYQALHAEDPYIDYLSDTIEVSDLESIGPIYRDGDLNIINSDTGTAGDTLTLTGTIWVTGKLTIATTRKDFILYLNGNTIFVEDDSTKPEKALAVGPDKPTISGIGCIIAVGDIYFAPDMNSNPDDYVFVMSVLGETYYQPSGEFYGSIAGYTTVQLWPLNQLNWREPPDTLNYPGAGSSNFYAIQNILSWIIYTQ